MINASGGSTPNSTTKKPTNTPPVVPTTGPGFPTHNPAMQNKNLMPGMPGSTVTSKPTTPTPIQPAPIKNSTGATPPAAPKFPDPTKNLIKVTDDKTDTVPGGSDNKTDSTKPKKKLNLKMILGVVVLLLVVIGSGAGFFLSQQQQDLRQQASETCPGTWTRSECPSNCVKKNAKCGDFSAGDCNQYSGCNFEEENNICSGSYSASNDVWKCVNPPEQPTTCTCDNGAESGSSGPGTCTKSDGSTYAQANRPGCAASGGTDTGDTDTGDTDTDGGGSGGGGSETTTTSTSKKWFNGVILQSDLGGSKRFTSPAVTTACGTNCSDFKWISDELGGHFDAQGKAGTSVNLSKTVTGYEKCSWQVHLRDCNDLNKRKTANYATGNTCTASFENPGNCNWEVELIFIMSPAAQTTLPEFEASCTTPQEYSADGSALSYKMNFKTPADVSQYNSFNYRLVASGAKWVAAGGTAAMYADFNTQFGVGWAGELNSSNVPAWAVLTLDSTRESTSFTWDNTTKIGKKGKTMKDLVAWTKANNLESVFSVKADYNNGFQSKGAVVKIAADACKPVPNTVTKAATGLTATAGDTKSVLKWKAPTDNGGSPITDYKVQYKKTTDTTWSTFTDGVKTTLAATVTGLTNDIEYQFRVLTVNAIGSSPASNVATTTPVAPPPTATVPSVPTALTATAENAQIALAWDEPATSGGTPITDYQIRMKDSSTSTFTVFEDEASADTVATVTNLTNGTSYDFAVLAINDIGSSELSESVTATPENSDDSSNDDDSSENDTDNSAATLGCNDVCETSSDCSDTNHACTITEDGSKKCRLESNPTSTSCTLLSDSDASTASQPTAPESLPQTGPEDWLNWFKAGLVTLGLGATLFFLL